MIRLGGLVNQKAFGKFEMGKVISNPFANAFIKEGEDHEVSMGQNQLDTIIKMATELKAKMGEDEKEIPAWIQDHISKAENYISQAAGNYHEYGTDESINEEPAKTTGEKIQNLNNRIKALKDKMAATKSTEQKNLIQQRLKNALQTLSNYKKQNITKESVNEGKFYAFFNNKKHEIEAKDLWDAKQKAITMLKVPKSKVGYLAIVNAKEHDGGSYRFESVNETVINEGPMNIKRGVPKMYVKYMAVQKKVNELEAKQKEMAAKYFAEKELNKKSKMLQDLKKGTEQLASYRRNLAAIEDKYVTGLYADAEYEGE